MRSGRTSWIQRKKRSIQIGKFKESFLFLLCFVLCWFYRHLRKVVVGTAVTCEAVSEFLRWERERERERERVVGLYFFWVEVDERSTPSFSKIYYYSQFNFYSFHEREHQICLEKDMTLVMKLSQYCKFATNKMKSRKEIYIIFFVPIHCSSAVVDFLFCN